MMRSTQGQLRAEEAEERGATVALRGADSTLTLEMSTKWGHHQVVITVQDTTGDPRWNQIGTDQEVSTDTRVTVGEGADVFLQSSSMEEGLHHTWQ